MLSNRNAIGSGGINGKGWLGSTQSELDFYGKLYRLYFCSLRRRIWPFRLLGPIGAVPAYYYPLPVYRLQAQDTAGYCRQLGLYFLFMFLLTSAW
jgi:rod shape determining protein RodA